MNVELLIGRKVFDESGRALGRIEEVLAIEQGSDLVVSEFHVGAGGLAERLSAYRLGHVRKPKRIPWQELDLSDPEKPVWRKR